MDCSFLYPAEAIGGAYPYQASDLSFRQKTSRMVSSVLYLRNDSCYPLILSSRVEMSGPESV